MTTESMLTSEAANTSEGQAASQEAVSAAPAGQPPSGEQSANQQQTTEGQTSESQQATEGKTEGDEAKPQGAPEKYEFTAPEGKAYDPEVIGQFSEVAKELNLPQDAAQKILDKVAPVIAERQVQAIEAARNAWAVTSKADKEFGGDSLSENLAVAKKALDSFGSDELRTLLNQSGLGNHPEVIRFMYRAGKAISEDVFVGGGQGGKTAPKSNSDYASSLYPSQQ